MALGSFATEVLADRPIGYWRLGEAPGAAVAADSSGRGNPGSYPATGVTLGQPGFHGGDTAALFDGVTGRVVVPNSATLNPARITMEAKVRWDGPTGLQQRILEKESYAGVTQYGLSVLPDARVHVELRMRTSGTTPQVVVADSTGVVALGAETHVAATYDGLAIRIYLNGAFDSATPVNIMPIDIDTKWPHVDNDPEVALVIGDRMSIIPPDTRHRSFNGLIDEVALFDTALLDSKILAHYQAQFAGTRTYEYAVKFVCGKSAGTVVAPGAYFTAVNVHNPAHAPAALRVKVAVALPGLTPGPVSKFIGAKLGPDEALEIDGPDIMKIAGSKAEFLKGFAVIQTASELDVVAVYTAADKDGQIETMHTERVPARRLESLNP
jgi:hypothetical protein